MSIFNELNMSEETAKNATLAFKLTVEFAPKVMKLHRSGFCAMMATIMDAWCEVHDEDPFEMYIRLTAAKMHLDEKLKEMNGSDSDD